MNYQDYAAAKQATTNNHAYYQPLTKMGSPFTMIPTSTPTLSTLEANNNTGYIITHQNTPSVVTYLTNASDTTTVIDTSPYSFPSTSDHHHNNSNNDMENDNNYSIFQRGHHQHHHHHHQQHQQQQQQHYQHQQQEEDRNGTLALNHIQMVSPWQNQSISTTSMMQQPDPHFTTLNNDEDLVVPLPERGVAGFVCKLYQSLEAPDGGEKYARWMKHNGKDMFIIDCIPKFTETVLPKLFKHCKFASFVRQLNIYGFQRDTDARKSKDSRDKEICRWYHTHFRPGRRDLFHLIRRKAPRYSRRKRIKMDQEEDKTGVNSGDESDQENGDDHTIHQISPSGTSAATTPTMANNNVNVVYSSSPPSAMFTDSHGLIDTSPLILSLPTSSSSTTAVSSPPPPPPPPPPPLPPSQQHQQQQQPCDQSPSSALPIQVHLKQEPSDSSSSMLAIQPHQQQDQHNNIQHCQQRQDQHIIHHQHQQQNDQHNIHHHHPQHEPSSSICLTSPLDMNHPLIHGNSATTDFTSFMEGSPHQAEQLHLLEQSQKPQEDHSLQQTQQFEQQLQQLQSQQFQQLQHQQHQQHQHHQQHQQILSFDPDPSMYNIMLQVPPPPPPPPPPSSSSTSSSSPSTLYQEELKAHISRLQHDYQQMHTYFTNELGKAHKQIEIQQLRTEFLERSLRGDR